MSAGEKDITTDNALIRVQQAFDKQVKPRLSDEYPHSYPYLLNRLSVVGVDKSGVTISTGDTHTVQWIAEHFGKGIKAFLAEALGRETVNITLIGEVE